GGGRGGGGGGRGGGGAGGAGGGGFGGGGGGACLAPPQGPRRESPVVVDEQGDSIARPDTAAGKHASHPAGTPLQGAPAEGSVPPPEGRTLPAPSRYGIEAAREALSHGRPGSLKPYSPSPLPR